MKKNLFVTIFICTLIGFTASAQQPTFLKGDMAVNAGIGFGGSYYGWYTGSGVSKIPFLSISAEYCIMDNLFDERSSLGVGALLGYTQATVKDLWKWSDIVIGARGALHYALVDKLDTYAGVMLGYDIYRSKYIGPGSSYVHDGAGSSKVSYALYAGARYYFTDAIGAFAELGFGYTILNVGIALKF
ncbi:MAG: hypothetical protein FWD56_06995 [Bacteroidales bacterium]|nr:hypothetical protein [Bacteroidales bacterium]